MYQRPKKRSVLINGHRTSLSLEDSFWIQFIEMFSKEKIKNQATNMNNESKANAHARAVYFNSTSFPNIV